MRKTLYAALTIALSPALLAASNNGDVEWAGLAHISTDAEYRPDGDPVSPSDTTTLRVRTYRGDVSSAGVIVAPEGGAVGDFVYYDAVWAYNDFDQIYDFWEVVVPAAAGARRYCMQVEDIDAGNGSNVDTDYLAAPHVSSYAADFDVLDARPDPAVCWLLPAPPSTDAAMPDVLSPDAARPDAQALDVEQPDAAALDAAQPDVVQPDAAQPDVAQPDVAQPDAALSDAAQPDVARLDAAQSDAARTDQGGGGDGPSCTPGCQDDAHRVVCGADGQPIVVPCSGGTICSAGRCVTEQESTPEPEQEGCGCSSLLGKASEITAIFGAAALLFLVRRRRG